jgi:hypothetical protein
MDKISKLSMLSLILVAVCIISRPVDADTSIYVFDPNKSTVIQTGGFAGVHETYTVTGQFRLSVDSDAGIASFEMVDANLTEPSGFLYTQNLGVLFNMTGLAGTVIDETTIEFEGKTADGTESDVRLKLSFSDDSVHITGSTTPPPNSADMFFYDIDAVATKKYAGGTGEPNNPYQITTADDLIALGESPEDYDKHFILTADIDLDPNLPGRKVFDKAVIAADTNDENWQFDGTSFTGVFDGNGHTISRLTITGEKYLGLFGALGEWNNIGAEVRSLGIADVNIAGSDRVGGLAGRSRNASITQSYSTGSVSGRGYVGGLVGDKSGDVVQCYSTAAVLGIRANQDMDGGVGGLVGENHGTMTHCYSIGSVRCDGPDTSWRGISIIGGLVGRNSEFEDLSAIVTNCFWDVETSGRLTSEGGTGKTTNEMQTAGTFITWGTCSNEGVWTINDGNDYPRLQWENKPGELIEVSPLSDLLTGTGTENDSFLIYTAEELNLIGLFPCEWDKYFKLMADIDMSGFDGKDDKPPFNIIAPGYVSGFEELLYFKGTPFTGLFDGNGYTISHLTGTGGCGGLFGGLGSGGEVRNLGVVDVNIIGSYVGGLVGFSEEGSLLTQCYSTGTVSGWYAGGLVGRNSGKITTSSSTCMLSGLSGTGWVVGGLVGGNQGSITTSYSAGTVSVDRSAAVGGLAGSNGGSITTSYSTGTVSGDSCVGGLVGVNQGIITMSYGTGIVTGDRFVGGLVGINEWYSAVTQCYSTGTVSGNEDMGGLVGYNWEDASVTSSFWDVETSGQATSAGGTGFTTAEMQMAGTFLGAGWDFVDEKTNGTEDIWWILEGQDYPRLWWELSD